MSFFIIRRMTMIWLVAFATGVAVVSPVVAGDRLTVSVTSNGWHTGIVVAVEDIPDTVLPEIADFPDARFVEFGWGDAAFYPDQEAGMAQGLAAIMTKSPAVMHVAGLWGQPSRVFPEAEVVVLTLDTKQFAALLTYLDGSFDRGGEERVASSAPGLYDFSLFYPARGAFHLGNTCNHWTAEGLAAAGLDIDPSGKRRASTLMRAVRKVADEQRAEGR